MATLVMPTRSRFGRGLFTAVPAPITTVDRLRVRGVMVIAAAGWFALAALVIAALAINNRSLEGLLTIGVAANLLPTSMALRRRYDAEARAAVGTLAAIMPALLVYLLAGHAWQMDGHMYFFVCLAMLVVMCDWRPIAIASGLIAAHHLLLEWLAPAWVFTGTGNLDRVIFHAVAVVLQCAVLSYVTSQLAHLLRAQDAAVDQSRGLASEADSERRRANAALEAAQIAADDAAAERRNRETIEQRVVAERDAELRTLANEFERSVSSVVKSIESAASQLAESSSNLDHIAGEAGREADDVATSAAEATIEIHRVARSLHSLSSSVSAIASTAQQQETLTRAAHDDGLHSVETISSLVERASRISSLVDTIRGVASKTNMLALNATIEAARAGDAGRGFVVVASEIKNLAGDAANASDQIANLLQSIDGAAAESQMRVERVTAGVKEVSEGAGAIASAAADQRSYAAQIEDSASRAATNADTIEHRIALAAAAVTAAATLSAKVRDSSGALLVDANELRLSTDRFVQFLRDDR